MNLNMILVVLYPPTSGSSLQNGCINTSLFSQGRLWTDAHVFVESCRIVVLRNLLCGHNLRCFAQWGGEGGRGRREST